MKVIKSYIRLFPAALLLLTACGPKGPGGNTDTKERWIKNDSTYGDLLTALKSSEKCKALILRNTLPIGKSLSETKQIDERVAQLQNLHTLTIYGVAQKSLPAELASLKNLKSLQIHGYGIVDSELTLPEDLSSLSKLKTLTISQCMLSQIPKLPPGLKRLDLSNNLMSEITPALFNSKLEFLDLSYNRLKTLPAISENGVMKSLDLSNNQFQTLPQGLSALSSLQFISISNNPFDMRYHAQDTLKWSKGAVRAEAINVPLPYATQLFSPYTRHASVTIDNDTVRQELKTTYPNIKFIWFAPSPARKPAEPKS